MELGFIYAEESPLMEEIDYEYTSGKGKVAACKYNLSGGVGKVRDYEEVAKGSAS